MKIVAIGGTGLIGSKVVNILQQNGHQAVAAAPDTDVDTISGKGLPEALEGAEVVVDVSNSPSFESDSAMAFFKTAGENISAADGGPGCRGTSCACGPWRSRQCHTRSHCPRSFA